jgi:hypothetical protein
MSQAAAAARGRGRPRAGQEIDLSKLPYVTIHYLIIKGGGTLFANPVEAALLGAPAHPTAADIRAHAEAMADVIINGIAVRPPGPGLGGTAGHTGAPQRMLGAG